MFKKVFFSIIITTQCFFFLSQSDEICNGSFEDSLTSWGVISNGAASVNTTISSTAAYSGNLGLVFEANDINPPASTCGLTSCLLNLEQGSYYRISFWAKSDTQHPLVVVLQATSAPFVNYAEGTFTTYNTWTQYEFYTADSNAVTGLKLKVKPEASGIYYFDDFLMESIPALPTYAEVCNQDFEFGLSGWIQPANGGGINASVENTEVQNGVSSVKVITSSTSSGQPIFSSCKSDIAENTTYEVSYWMKCDFGASADPQPHIVEVSSSLAEPPYTTYGFMSMTPSDSWTEYSFITQSDTTVYSNVRFAKFKFFNDGVYYIDNINIEEVTLSCDSEGVDVVSACDSYTWSNGITYDANNYNSATTIAAQTPGLFDVGPNTTWTNAYTSCVLLDGNNGAEQTFVINVTNLPPGGANYRVAKTVANGNWFNSNAQPLVLGLNTITVASVIFDRIVKFQFSSGAVEFDDLSSNGNLLYSSIPTQTFINAAGCDSVVTLDLTLSNSSTGIDVVQACDSYTWINGITYDASNYNSATTIDAQTPGLFDVGPNITWTNAYTACVLGDGNEGAQQTLVMNVTSLPPGGANYRVAKTVANGNWFNGNAQALTLGLNTITVPAVAFDRIVKFQFSNGAVEFDELSLNGTINYSSIPTFTLTNAEGCDSIVTLDLTLTSSSVGTDVVQACDSYTWINGITYDASNYNSATTIDAQTPGLFDVGPNTTWTNAYTACVLGDGNNGAQQTLVMNVTSLPPGGANYRVAKTVANGNWFNGNAQALTLGLNTITVPAVAFDRIVKFQFSSGAVEFDEMSLNGNTVYSSIATYALTSANGCDSIVTLDLTLTNSSIGIDVIEACDSYTWIDGITYTAGNYNMPTTIDAQTPPLFETGPNTTWTNVYTACVLGDGNNGAQQTLTINITTLPPGANYRIVKTVANGNFFNGNAIALTLGLNTISVPAVAFDRVVKFQFSDGGAEFDEISLNGNTVYSSTPTFALSNSVGCDSTVTLDLTINNSSTATDVITACDSYTWIDGNTYTASNNSATWTITETSCGPGQTPIEIIFTPDNYGGESSWILFGDAGSIANASPGTYSSAQPGVPISTFACADTGQLYDIIVQDTEGNGFSGAVGGNIQVIDCDGNILYNLRDEYPNGNFNFLATSPQFEPAECTTASPISGCDITVTLDLTINNSNTGIDVITACDAYTWIDGNTYTTSNNTATHTLTNSIGCDSVVTLDLTINNSSSSVDVVTACDTYNWIDGNTYSASNNSATFVTTNLAGCDNTILLNLTLNSANSGTDVIIACDAYTWIDGNTYTASNNSATHTLINAAGCDSIVSLDLTINNSSTATDVITACDTYTWIDGNTYTTNNNSATHTLTNSVGCDSVVTLDLTINNTTSIVDEITACDAYTWIDGNTYSASNNSATFVTTNLAGCDNTILLNLTLNSANAGTDVITACDSYTWIDGNTYTATNNSATHTLINASGCDSIVTLDLTINNSNTGIDVIIACDAYTWIDGNTYTASNNSATHTLINAAGCDSIVSLDLTINNSNTGIDVVTACDTYTWIDGNTYTTSNNTATHTLTNSVGCDSVVTLDLIINNSSSSVDVVTACDTYNWIDGNTYSASNNSATFVTTNLAGCDNTILLNLTLNSANTGTDVITACDSYTWIDGNTYTASNNSATHTLSNASGCDSIVTLDLTINNSNIGIDVIIACGAYTWIDGNTYTTSNNSATHTVTNAAGCDSIVSLDLTINNSNTGIDVVTACDTYTWIDGNTYTTSNNTATHTLTNSVGCDSVVTLDLTINNSNTGIDEITACDAYTWIDGNTYTASNNSATHILTNTAGCDSIVTLNLTVNSSYSTIDVQGSCDSYTWIDGNTYTSSNNTASVLLTSSAGCDSLVTLDLTIDSSLSSTDTQVACGSFTWIDGISYSANNNTATFLLTAIGGCDSLVTLNLTINSATTGVDEIVACDTYTWIDGNTYTENNSSATHMLTNSVGCDSLVTLDLTINNSNTGIDNITACDAHTWIDGNTYTNSNNTATHTLSNAFGCDSVVTLNLTINSSSSSIDVVSQCGAYTWIDGIEYTESNNVATFVTTNASGCDSTITLDLTILESSNSTDEHEACGAFTWIDGNTYTESNNTATFITTNVSGCDSIITLALTLTILDPDLGPDEFLCANDSIALSPQEPGFEYIWNTGETTESIYVTEEGIYYVTVTDPETACTESDTVFVTEIPVSQEIDVQSACDAYTWLDGITYTESNNTATYIETSVVGCDSVVYTLNLTIGGPTCFAIPEGLSPNGDNTNDTWTIGGLNQYPDAVILVFNRWGNEVYRGDAFSDPWDGSFQGDPQPTADYYYILDLGDGQKFNGVVTLKR